MDRDAGLCLKRKKRRHCVRVGSPRPELTAVNQEWALDLAHDVIAAGRNIRVLSVVDAFTRECLALEVDTGLPSLTLQIHLYLRLRGLADVDHGLAFEHHCGQEFSVGQAFLADGASGKAAISRMLERGNTDS